jgi:hypothetical protein
MASGIKTDGNIGFTGGMDTSRAPSLIGRNQYVYSVNMEIPKAKEGIRTRRGFKCIKIKFNSNSEKEIFETGNVQGIGNYFNQSTRSIVIVVSINGYIIELVLQGDGSYVANYANFNNNPNIKKCHINAVPNGVIISDGESAPIYILGNKKGRVSPSNRGIGPNHGGVYVQNRFWYIDQSKKYVIASTIQDPISLDEGILTNILGFAIPDETEEFVAIGKQRTVSRDATGGNLAMASLTSNYSADVRGSREQWGNQSGIGRIENVVNGVGAVSPFSFESANSNIYFRNKDYGFMSTRSAQYQFTNNDSYSPISIESSAFFDNDTKEFLEFAYTKFYNTRIYNTIGPSINENGFVYWNGLLVMSPDIYFSTKDRSEINRVESVYTGIRPWCMTTSEDTNNIFIMSYDTDCVNRLYTIDEDIDYDVDYKGKRVNIESKILTRLFDFEAPFISKKSKTQFFFIESKRDYNVNVYSRVSPESSFEEVYSSSVKIKTPGGQSLFPFDTDSRISDKPIIFPDSDEEFFQKQDLFIFKGSINLLKHIRSSLILNNDISSNNSDIIKLEKSSCINPNLIYSYSINGTDCIYPKDNSHTYVKYVDPSFKLITMKEINRYRWIRKGDKGDKGDTGERGPRGFTGQAGSSGTFNSNITGLTGGGLTNLDGIETISKTVPNIITFTIGIELQDWILLAQTTEVEDPTNGIVFPDDYNSVTNRKVWIRVR